MKSQIKNTGIFILFFIVVFGFVFQELVVKVKAEEIEEESQTVCSYEAMVEEVAYMTPTTRRWTSNLQPGSEDRVWKNQHYAPPSALAKKCALKAVGDGSLSSIGVGWTISYVKGIQGV